MNELVVLEKTERKVAQNATKAYMDGKLIPWQDYNDKVALANAVLKLRDMTVWDKDAGKEVLLINKCTPESIEQALFDMLAQGLDVGLGQGYFIPYKNRLTFSRDYLGTITLVKRLNPKVADVFYNIVYKGDEFTYDLVLGQPRNIVHKQKLENVDSVKIVAAYAVAIGHDEKPLRTVIRTWKQIKTSWGQSRQQVFDAQGNIVSKTHRNFPEEMAQRTVINLLCKHYIRSADGYKVLHQSINRPEIVDATQEIEAEKETVANRGDVVDIKVTSQAVEAKKDENEFAFSLLEYVEEMETIEELEAAWKLNAERIKKHPDYQMIARRFTERRDELTKKQSEHIEDKNIEEEDIEAGF